MFHECPNCKQRTLLCVDTEDGTKNVCHCANCGYHQETSLGEIKKTDEKD